MAEEPEPEPAAWKEDQPPGRAAAPRISRESERFAEAVTEPWYYRFLDTYAKAGLWFTVSLIACGTILSLVAAVKVARADPVMAAIGVVLTVSASGTALITVLISIAFILLLVDAARNLREIRRAQSEGAKDLGPARHRKRG